LEIGARTIVKKSIALFPEKYYHATGFSEDRLKHGVWSNEITGLFEISLFIY
jgi:hypothetical protein